MTTCPFCGSDKVYSLLNTLRCKRCKQIWKEGEDVPPAEPSPSLRVTMRTDPLETRMEKRLEECIRRSGGRFSITSSPWLVGDISRELFLRYLKRCVKDRALDETKDRYGRTWYSRPGAKK